MSRFDRTFRLINQGQQVGRPRLVTNIPKLDSTIFGINKGNTILLGGDTGTGKSSFVRSVFIHNVYEQYKRINDPTRMDVQFVDFSLEISTELNVGTAIVRQLYTDYQKVVTMDRLFGWSDARLTPDETSLIESYRAYFDEFEQKSIIVDEDVTPQLFHDVLLQVAKTHGTFEHDREDINRCGKYTSNNPNMHIIVCVDTINLTEGQGAAKFIIDNLSRIGIKFRKKCGMILIFVQQFGSDIASTDRARHGITTPILKDFMDSTGPTKDATIVMGLYSPIRYMKEDQKEFRGYNMEILKNWMVSLHVLKNRYGQVNKWIPLKFDGAVGYFEQLPPVELMNDEAYIRATNH